VHPHACSTCAFTSAYKSHFVRHVERCSGVAQEPKDVEVL
jgi:hypothetical protein